MLNPNNPKPSKLTEEELAKILSPMIASLTDEQWRLVASPLTALFNIQAPIKNETLGPSNSSYLEEILALKGSGYNKFLTPPPKLTPELAEEIAKLSEDEQHLVNLYLQNPDLSQKELRTLAEKQAKERSLSDRRPKR